MGKNKKIPLWGKLCAGFLCAAMAVIMAGDAGSGLKAQGSTVDSLKEQMAKLQQENAERDAKIKELGADIEDNEDAMALVSEQIDGINDEIAKYGQLVAAKKQSIDEKNEEIENIERAIAEKEQEIENKKAEIVQMQAQNTENLEKFAKLARAMYMNNSSNTIPVLNGSDNWYDYFVYSDVVRNISGQNAKFMQDLLDSIQEQENLIQSLNDEIESLENDKQELNAQKEVLQTEMNELENDKSAYETAVTEKKNYLYGLAANNASLKNRIDGLEYENAAAIKKMEEMNEQIEQLIREANAGTDSSGIVSSTDFIWPVEPKFQYITCGFVSYDPYHGGAHRGIDIGNAGIANTNIYAVQSGTVIAVFSGCTHNYGKNYTCCSSYGNYVIVKHPNGLSTLYAHMSKVNVSMGQTVNQGDVIGLVGTTGWSTGNHLHFEVRGTDGVATNPFNYTYVNI